MGRTEFLVVLVSVLLASSCAEQDPVADVKDSSYDMGWSFGGQELCTGFEDSFGTPEVRDELGRQASEVIVDRWNGYVARMVAESEQSQLDATYFLSGMWDSAVSRCPEWFPTTSVAGRPGGGEPQFVALTIDGLEPGSFVEATADLISTTTTLRPTTTTTSSASYPRPPQSDEVYAILDYYDAWNASYFSGNTGIRDFWAERNHPALECERVDFEQVLLPEDDADLGSVHHAPILNGVLIVEEDPVMGPVAVVPRTTTIDTEVLGGQSTDYLFIIGGFAYTFILDCQS